MATGRRATPAPCAAASAIVMDESKMVPLIAGQATPAAANQRGYSSAWYERKSDSSARSAGAEMRSAIRGAQTADIGAAKR
jgi:hypothetical protein